MGFIILIKVKEALASLGFFIENGIAQIKELIAEKIFTDEITAKRIRMIDQATGEIYCTWIEQGEEVEPVEVRPQQAALFEALKTRR